LPIVAVGVLQFRVPIEAGGSTSNLLVPLYVVIAGAAVAHIWRKATSPSEPASSRPALLHVAIAIFIGLYALQALYSSDFSKALEQMVFFYVPFALLFVLLSEVRWSPRVLAGCVAVLLVLALAFSGIGFWEYHRRELFWNPKVISANQFQSYFRVNSVFWDPNIYGRFLMVVIVVVTAMMLWSDRRRVILGATGVLAVLWGGLVLTCSQSSFASPTLPVTVAAEQGLLGLVAYALVLVAGFRVLLGRGAGVAAPRGPPASAQRADGSLQGIPRAIYQAAQAALTAAFAALVVHTMM